MKHKIGVFGSAEGDFDTILPKLISLGKELSNKDLILITGATTGVTNVVVSEAHKHGTELWGFSAGTGQKSHKKLAPKLDSSIYTKLFFVPKSYAFASNLDVCRKYRNVTSTATCDAGIIVSGRWGTMNEFTNLFDMGKIIGVLTGTGGIADELERLMAKIKKPSKAKVFFDNNPKALVDKILHEL